MRRLLSLGALAAPLVLACGNTTPPAAPNAFDRPEAIAFFCWDLDASLPVALDECAPTPVLEGEEDRAEPRDGFALHALVTQTTTGEVAAVRLSGADGEPGAIDSDVRVPGFTFIATGDVPSGVVVSRNDPQHVFVVSRGSAQIHVIEAVAFRKGTGTEVRVYEPGDLLPVGSRPSDLVLTPDGSAIVVALPTEGRVAFIPILGGGELGAAEFIDLVTEIPPPVDLTTLDPADLPAAYVFTCEVTPVPTPAAPIPPRAPASLGTTPEPWALLVDELTGEILVADRRLPLVHRLDPVTRTELAPLSVSVPVRELAVTPFVPRTSDPADTAATERYLYAVDALDRSVLAVDISDPATPRYGAVIPTSVALPGDRLDSPLPARAIAVVAPAYDPDAITFCEDGDQGLYASTINLHGVFLAVGTEDGAVRFFDIYDLDTPCRGIDCAEDRTNPNPDDHVVAIARHRPRIGTVLDEPVQLTPDPVWSTAGASLAVEPDGTTTQPGRVPNLGEVTCEGSLGQVFPLTGTPRVCAITDPWSSINQAFSIAWEAAIPGTTTSGANLDPTESMLETRTDYCQLGVLGSEDVPTEGSLAGYAGDVVAITANLPPTILGGDETVLTRCELLTQRTASGTTTPILLPILSASTPDDVRDTYVGRLRVGDPLDLPGFTFEDVRICFPELLEIEVRARDAFVVQSTRAGFRHPVRRAEDGACAVDLARDAALERGRARCGQSFETPEIRLALGGCDPRTVDDGAALDLTVGEVPVPLSLNVSTVGGGNEASLLETLVYNDVDQRLYAIDQANQGLLRIRLTSLTVQQTFR